MLDIGNPDIGWVKLAESMGVQAAQADNCERFADLLAGSVNRSGPFLIELTI
jgi:acetolactate synthase-1/2/3 large subunit